MGPRCDEMSRHAEIEKHKERSRWLEVVLGWGMSLFLAANDSLYIIKLSDHDRHGTCMTELMAVMIGFTVAYDFIQEHTNVSGQINLDPGRAAPDGALKWSFPPQGQVGPLRAPFIAEVHSGKDTVVTVLEFLSGYLENQIVDYVVYIRAFPKREDGHFTAVAIIWRRGNVAALGPGQMAQFVEAHSFGTAALDANAFAAYESRNYGHLPAVPPGSLGLQNPL